jgi:hypothetical protein
MIVSPGLGGEEQAVLGMDGLWRLPVARTRSITPENPTGEKGRGGTATDGTGARAARELGQGWKVSPSIDLAPGQTAVLADVPGPGIIQHFWLTAPEGVERTAVLRAYWDGERHPSIEVPLGDFFCNGWGQRAMVNSLPVAVNPAGGFNSYWPMPFREHARITLEHLGRRVVGRSVPVYYQISYAQTGVPVDAAYLHATWRRSNPLGEREVHTVLDGVRGRGQYVGTYLAWQANSDGWWGEGEVKFYLDGDTEFPTICGTGTEDYVGGAWNFEHPKGSYGSYSTPFLGMPQVLGDGVYQAGQRFGLYRWHIPDPIRFDEDIRVTVQALGWGTLGRYRPLRDDVASTAFWYQVEPHEPFGPLPAAKELRV